MQHIPVLLVSVLVLYFLGIRFIGRPMAKFSWRFWTETPYRAASVWSWLLYPMAHAHPACLRSETSIQEFAIPDYETCLFREYRRTPLIGRYVRTWRGEKGCGMLKHNWLHSCSLSGCSEYWDWHRDRYLTAASVLWLPRLAALVPLHFFAAILRIGQWYNATGWMSVARSIDIR